MSCVVALVGRPNVGKSTLFNRLSQKKKAIVHDAPGVTRDRQYGEASLGDLAFTLVDTAGIWQPENDETGSQARSQSQTDQAVVTADVLWFVVDGMAGVTAEDERIAKSLRKAKQPIFLVVNKCEASSAQMQAASFYKLGLGDPICISAAHNEGFADLFDILEPFVEEAREKDPESDPNKPLQLAVVGRPNVGKSTFINQVLGEDRLVTSDEAGTTRDSVDVDFTFEGAPFRLVDTAGVRRKSKVVSVLEREIVHETKRVIQYAESVVLMVDATMPLEKQDLTLARQVVDEGRAMVVVLNKMDKVRDREALIKETRLRLDRELAQAKDIPLVAISSLKRKNLRSVFKAIQALQKVWTQRISTSRLNKWLEDALDENPPPLVRGRSLKIRYVTQIKSRPPTFALFVTRAAQFPESYLRYLRNRLRDTFDFQGVPLRLVLKEPNNPYAS